MFVYLCNYQLRSLRILCGKLACGLFLPDFGQENATQSIVCRVAILVEFLFEARVISETLGYFTTSCAVRN